jgi:hypothetical protein
MKNWLVYLCISLVAGCANQLATNPNAALKPSGFVLVREHVDSVKTDLGDQYQRIQYGWDYDIGSAKVITYSMEGELLSTEVANDLTLNTSEAELAYGFELVRSNKELKAASAKPDATLYGGFSYRNATDESPAAVFCRSKSRCIHVLISGGVAGEILYGHAIVDLASGKVVDPRFIEISSPHHKK